jgi:tRNA(adenine34) deaminase
MDMNQFNLELSDPRHEFHLMHMEIAIQEAKIAEQEDEVPVGAVIVSAQKGIIARSHNQRELLKDPTAHAEMIAITQAAQFLQSWRLENCILYVTLEPCPMCAGAIVQSRIPWVVYGCMDPKAGACHSLFNLLTDQRLNHRSRVVSGVLENECSSILTNFFQKKRNNRKGLPKL